jgi:hypothetical protein
MVVSRKISKKLVLKVAGEILEGNRHPSKISSTASRP